MANVLRRLVTVAVLAALIAPVLLGRDSFPLSTYPMYSQQRGDTVELYTAVGVDPDDEIRRLGLRVIGDSDDPLIVASLIRQAARTGSAALEPLCDDIADRAPEDVVRVEVVAERHDVVARTRGNPSLVSRTVLVDCEVGAA